MNLPNTVAQRMASGTAAHGGLAASAGCSSPLAMHMHSASEVRAAAAGSPTADITSELCARLTVAAVAAR